MTYTQNMGIILIDKSPQKDIVMCTDATTRPPLGLMPEKLWMEQLGADSSEAKAFRVSELLATMKRYAERGLPVPVEWVAELERRLN